MYTVTEKVLLVYAVTFFGLENESKIKSFLKARSFDIDLAIWRNVYDSLISESKQAHYSNVVEYCEDVRYTKLIQTFKEKYRMRQGILEGTVDSSEYFRSLENIGKNILETQEITSDEIDQYYTLNIKPLIKEPTEVFYTRCEILPKLEMCEKTKTKAKTEEIKEDVENLVVVEDVISKQNKRYYQKMNEQEREFDDFVDKFDDYFYYKSENFLRPHDSPLSHLFPALGKIKNIEERKELMNKEVVQMDRKHKIEHKIKTKGNKKIYTHEKQYLLIEEKISGKKNAEKDKQSWWSEVKIIIGAIVFCLEGNENEDIKKQYEKLKDIASQIKKESVLVLVIFNVLMVIQNLMFIVEGDLFGDLFEFKKILISFYDYYRK